MNISLECDDGYYGINCEHTCDNCRSDTTCNKSTGVCPSGCQMWWITDICQTYIDIIPTKNRTVVIDGTTESSLSVTWQKLNVSDDVRHQYGYQIMIKENDTTTYTVNERVMHDESSGLFIASDLSYNTVYVVQVTPYRVWENITDPGLLYSQITQKTDCTYPEQPSKPSMNIITSSTETMTALLEVTYQNVSYINPKCDEITDAWLKIYRDENLVIKLHMNINETSYSFNLNVSGSYKAATTVENNQGFNATSSFTDSTYWEPMKKATMVGGGLEKDIIFISSGVVVSALVIFAVSLAAVFIMKKRRRKNEDHNMKLSTSQEDNPELTERVNSAIERRIGDDEDSVKSIQAGQEEPNTGENRSTLKNKFKPVIGNTQYENIEIQKGPPKLTTKKPMNTSKPENDKKEHPTTETVTVKPRVPEKQITKEPSESKQSPSSDEHIYNNMEVTQTTHAPVNVDDFEAYVNNKKSGVDGFAEEYSSLPQDDKTKCPSGLTKDNKAKNRFLNIYPYEHSRVILNVGIEIDDSDYINANYIKGFTKDKEYIATQGPKDTTVGDFWRMIWQEGSNRIIMVANVKENGKSRCYPYWSEEIGSTIKQGSFTITTDGVESCADYTTRILTLRKQNETRTIHQSHFTSWEDKNKPLYGATTLLAFFGKVHAFDRFSKGPMVVHCSAGVGRTGTFIALDILQQEATIERTIGVYQCVKILRDQRMSMVQTKEQYIFLHDALVEYTLCGDTSYSCTGFEKTLSKICEPGRGPRGISELETQFQMITKMKPTPVNAGREGLAPVHKDKNRDLAIIPGDFDRPYLDGNANERYINAVFVDSLKVHDFYVVTQMPLPETIADFWRLVFSQKSQSIVMLNQIQEGDDNCLPYWPTKETPTQNYGPIEVNLVNTDDGNVLNTITTRNFVVKNTANHYEDDLLVRQFQLLNWPNTESVPPNKSDLLSLLALLQDWQQQNTNSTERGNTIVHCLTGGVQSGVFCGVSHTLHRMTIEQEIDAFLAVRYVTRRRPQFFKTMTEYKFLYEMAIHHMSQYADYQNIR